MTEWPLPEKQRIPEGHYQFRLNREPDLKAFTHKDKDGNEQKGRKLVIYAVGLNENGEFRISDGLLPWEDRYTDLCAALGVEHGRDIAVTGRIFEADVEYQASKSDPTKSYPHLTNITASADLGGSKDVPKSGAGDDIPF